MSERYFITGVQIGIVQTEAEKSRLSRKVLSDLLNEIGENQFIGRIPPTDKPEQFEIIIRKKPDDELLEKLSELEHVQWQTWAKVKDTEHPLLNKNYSDLTEEEKEKDRIFARKILEVIEESNRK